VPSARSGVPPANGSDTGNAETPTIVAGPPGIQPGDAETTVPTPRSAIPAPRAATVPPAATAGHPTDERLADGHPTDGASRPGRQSSHAESRRWVAARWRALARGLWVAAAGALALSGSLPRLWEALGERDPSAYRLTAVLAGAVALLARARRAPGEPSIHDRQVDYLIGLPLLLLAAGELTVPPARFHGRFWASHADLLALPLLAGGAIAVVFGTRVLWRQRVTLAAWAVILIPFPADAIRRACEVLSWPALALAREVGTWPGGWQVIASPPGDTVIRLGGHTTTVTSTVASDVAFGGATRGLAGALAAVAMVIVFAATATSWGGALRRALATAGVCAVTLAGRILVAVVAGVLAGPSGASTVLGRGGDIVTLALVLAAVVGIGVTAGTRRTRRGARRAGQARAGRPAVPRALAALALVALVCAGLAVLDVTGNRTVSTGPTSSAAATSRAGGLQ
jgi:hypothetical protein